MGKCYLITSYKKSANTSQFKDSPADIRSTTYLRISLPANDSTANIYVTPEESHIGVILVTWNHPIKTFKVRNGIFMEWAMREEFRARKSTKRSPCNNDLREKEFYQVKYYFFSIYQGGPVCRNNGYRVSGQKEYFRAELFERRSGGKFESNF